MVVNVKCETCEYHSTWAEQGIELGFVCKHPTQTEKPGLMYGRFFSHIITSPKWCPIDKETEKRFSDADGLIHLYREIK